MMLVAACPGGNVSNFLVWMARGNTALSVSMTAVTSTAAVVRHTPFNLAFWASMDPDTRACWRHGCRGCGGHVHHHTAAAGPATGRGHVGAGALSRNSPHASSGRCALPTGRFFWLHPVRVLAQPRVPHPGCPAGAAYRHRAQRHGPGPGLHALRACCELPTRDRRAISLEVGVQNSGLGLALIFNFFAGLGGTAMVAAWWGTWHLVGGFTMAVDLVENRCPRRHPTGPPGAHFHQPRSG